MDVVKTRIQLDPAKYSGGMIAAFRQVVAAEGMSALATGLGPTVAGYFVQGWFKFGGVELVKTQMAMYLGERKAWENRNNIYLLAAASAEFVADVFLCPLEATRIRLVSDPSFGKGIPGARRSSLLCCCSVSLLPLTRFLFCVAPLTRQMPCPRFSPKTA